MEDEGVTDAETATVDVFLVVGSHAPRHLVPPLLKQLRDGGLAADTDYAGRSLKGQLTQAGRPGAKTTVIIRAGTHKSANRAGRTNRCPRGPFGTLAMRWRTTCAASRREELVGQDAHALRLGRAPPRPRRPRLRRPPRPHRHHQLVINPELRARGGRARAPDPQRVRAARRGNARRAQPRDRQPEHADRRSRAPGRQRSRSSTARRRSFQLDEENVDETLRLRYRWLDLRREKLQRNITCGQRWSAIIRREMEAAGFLDIQTPILFKPTRRARATSSSRAACSRAASSRCRRARRS